MTRSWSPIALASGYPVPVGAYSPAARAGNLIFVSGQVPKDPRTGEVEPGDVRAQTRRVLANVAAVLEAASASLHDVVSVTAYLANADDWAAFNEVYRDVFRPPYPTRTTVGAQLRGILVEVSAIAVAPTAGG
ncbi:MAG: RidA family protein [Gemmatimonadaceae bacterium]